jgi:hypothetical protein
LNGFLPFRQAAGDILIVNGQHPHTDYVSPSGPVTFLIIALGLTISGAVAWHP